MAFISEIDKLLQADENNVQVTKCFLSDFSPDTLEVLNQAAVLYDTVCRAFSQGFHDHFRELATEISTLGLSTFAEFVEKLSGPVPQEREAQYTRATEVLNRYYEREGRRILLVRLGVLYGTAAADLLRMRVTVPLAYVRIQCESLALMQLMHATPEIAREWIEINTEVQGKAFFRAYQPAVKGVLRSFNLEFAYDNASSIALHSRFAGVAFGTAVTSRVVDGKIVQEIKVKAQEFDLDNPDPFLLIVLHVVRVQERILSRLAEMNREIDDPLLLETRIPQFSRAVNALYETFERRRPDLVARYKHACDTNHPD